MPADSCSRITIVSFDTQSVQFSQKCMLEAHMLSDGCICCKPAGRDAHVQVLRWLRCNGLPNSSEDDADSGFEEVREAHALSIWEVSAQWAALCREDPAACPPQSSPSWLASSACMLAVASAPMNLSAFMVALASAVPANVIV